LCKGSVAGLKLVLYRPERGRGTDSRRGHWPTRQQRPLVSAALIAFKWEGLIRVKPKGKWGKRVKSVLNAPLWQALRWGEVKLSEKRPAGVVASEAE
jgi:hypothetical protein